MREQGLDAGWRQMSVGLHWSDLILAIKFAAASRLVTPRGAKGSLSEDLQAVEVLAEMNATRRLRHASVSRRGS